MPLAIITGASSGIGRGFAIQLRERGYDEFWLVARRRERLEELASELGCKCEIIVADLSENAGVEKVGELLNIRRPEVDMLVSAAGFGDFGAQDELTDEDGDILYSFYAGNEGDPIGATRTMLRELPSFPHMATT